MGDIAFDFIGARYVSPTGGARRHYQSEMLATMGHDEILTACHDARTFKVALQMLPAGQAVSVKVVNYHGLSARSHGLSRTMIYCIYRSSGTELMTAMPAVWLVYLSSLHYH